MPDDYSANVQTTGAVAVGGSATGVIETAHDQDWFAVELVAGRTYQFDLGGSPSGGGTLRDTFLRAIYDSEGRYQSDSYNDDFEGGRDSRVTFTASQSGTYYVRASGDRDETGSYTLRVSDVTPGPVEDPPPVEPPAETVAPEEPAPARAAAEDLGDITELAAARFPLGTLDGGADGVAWYRFTLSEARAVGLGLRRQDADADLVLEDAEGNVLHSSERSGTANEWMRETLLAGTYYVRVEAQEAGANAYVFRYGVGDADPAEVTRLETEQESVQEQVQQQPPAFGSQFYGFDLPENTDGSANRISLGTVSAVDPEGDTLTYSIEGGNAAGLFEIDAAGGELFYTGGGEDYETGSTSFELTVRASDGDQTTDTTATVNVTDVAEAPAFGQAGYVFELPEDTDGSANRISLGTVSATDPEGDTLTYSIEGGNAARLFEIDAASGELFYTGTGEDYETGSTSFELTVRASDGDQTTDTTATVNVTDVAEAPAFGQAGYVFDLPENTDGSANRISLGTVSATDPDGGSVTYSIEGGNAAGLFEIDAASGELFYTGGGEDYETGSTSFELTVRASDGDQTTDTTATVSVTDVDEPVEGNPPVAQPDQSTPQTVSEPAGEDFSAGTSTSGRVAVGDTATGNIGSNGDGDWFAVELVAGRTYVIDLRGSPTDDGTLSDPYLRGIHDSDGNRIARTSNNDGGEGYNSRVTFTATESGTHYIAAGAAGIFSGRGTYEVEVTDTTPPIVGPDPDSEEPPDTQEQEQVQQQEQDEPPAETVIPPAEPETAQAQDEAASVSEGGTDLPADSTTTGRVAVGGSATGRVEHTRDRDWFAVDLEADKRYQFDLEGRATGDGSLWDPYLRGIYDEEGDWHDGTANDDTYLTYNSRVYFTPDEGATYYVSAGGARNKTGTYTLTVTEVSDDYAADPTTTGTVVVGGSATGNIDSPREQDWFAVELEADKTYRFDLDGRLTGDGSLWDLYLSGIYDENGGLIDGTTDDDSIYNSRVNFTPDEDATYYVSAAAGRYDAGTYTLTVTEVSDDYAADSTTTGTVVVGGSATGDIETSGDRDWFEVELEAGKRYRFDLDGSFTDGGTLYDPYLRGIYDEDGNRLAGTTNGDGGVGRNSRVSFRPDEGATYYVSAGSARSDIGTAGGGERRDVGTYTLTVTDLSDDDYAANRSTTGTVVVGGSATGNLEYIHDTDWFAVTLEAGQPYRIDLQGSPTGGGTLVDPYLRGIYDEDGDWVYGTADNNDGVGRNSRVYFTPDEGATYYVSASAFRGISYTYVGTYTLAVTEYSDDYAANRSTTGTVMVGGSATGSIEPAGDRDWFAVELEAGKRYRIDLEGSPTGGGTLTNPVLRGIYDSEGRYQSGSYNDDGGVGRNSRVLFTPDEDATYYVSAGGYVPANAGYSQVGSYTLSVEDVDGM